MLTCINKISKNLFLLSAFGCIMILASCSFVRGEDPSLGATISAMQNQATALSLQITQDTLNLQTTQLAQQSALLSQPSPTIQSPEAQTITTNTPEPPSTIAPLIHDNELDQKIKSAKILLFEDTSGNRLGLVRYIKDALDDGGYSYVDVGSAQGWLKDRLVSEEEWDLIIIASELAGRTSPGGAGRISGEYFDYLKQRLDNGAAMILEIWNLDDIGQGDIRPILDDCGVEFQSDWASPPSISVWFLEPEHPVFNQPNVVGPSLRDFEHLWSDSGDLIRIKQSQGTPAGDAVLLAVTKFDNKSKNGVLASCMGGRLIIQTFATHQYKRENVINLWENYIYYGLYNHFQKIAP